MKNQFSIFIAVLIVTVLCAYMFLFQVRYDEVAVQTTFDKVGDAGIKSDPGLYFRMPWPIQKVNTYPTRVQLLEDQLEEQQTADGYAVIINTYLAWRIVDPHKFFVTLKNVDNARKQLNPLLRDVRGIISKYRFDQMLNINSEQLKLSQIEEEAVAQLQDRINSQGFGIQVERVGVRRIVLPEKVTEKVFDRMRQTRERLAENARAEGRAKAAAIKSEARSAQQRILAFAERRAQSIRSEGDREAATYYEKFRGNEEFAIFQRKIEALKKMLAHNTTFVLDANDISLLKMLKTETTTQGTPTANQPAGELSPVSQNR